MLSRWPLASAKSPIIVRDIVKGRQDGQQGGPWDFQACDEADGLKIKWKVACDVRHEERTAVGGEDASKRACEVKRGEKKLKKGQK